MNRYFVVTVISLCGLSAVQVVSAKEVDDLRSEVDKLAAPYLVVGADLRVRISQTLFTKVTTAISSLPAAKRRATFDGQQAAGYVWNQGGGILGCGGFAEINNGGKDFHFTVDISGLSAVWQPDGRMAVHLNAAANASGTIHGHVRGPAGMCSGPSLKYPVGRWSCDCPIGGGAGTVVGISTSKGSNFDGVLTIYPTLEGDISYGLVLTSPQSLSVTVSAGLQQIGTIGIPMSFPLPSAPLLQGKIAGVVKSEGTLNIGGKSRPYSLGISNVRIHPDAQGMELLADSKIASVVK